jgi:tetratricopeptide (TPR) repeat protein
MEELMEKFSPEPEFYLNSVYPKMQELQRSIDNADTHREKGETFAAEYEYSTALKVDEENVRANFGIGLTYLQRGENNKADDIFERLVKLDAAFEAEHKHMFNDFGINLRKAKMYDQAVTYYSRALEMTTDDENLHVNVARALFETKNVDGCVEHLLKALEIAPQQEQAIKFLRWLDEKRLVPGPVADRVRQAITAAPAPSP